MRKRGFTLIEILVVIGIISLLLAYLVVQFNKPIGPEEGTKGLLLQLSAAIDSYNNEFRAFPPDGYDEPVFAPNGRELKGSACLAYYLAWMYSDGAGGFVEFEMKRPDYTDPERTGEVPVNGGAQFWPGCNPGKHLNAYGEILDLFGNALRYDNCGLFTPDPQPAAGGGDPDPRVDGNGGRLFSSRRYDLWSCGADGGRTDAAAKDDIIAGREDRR